MVATEAEPLFAIEAKERQGARNDLKNISQKFEQCNKGKASEQAAKSLNTNRQYVSQAKKLKAEHPQIA